FWRSAGHPRLWCEAVSDGVWHIRRSAVATGRAASSRARRCRRHRDATRLQPGIGKLDDRAPNRWSDPAVDAVERDDVEFAEIGEARLQELVETCFDKADVGQPRGFGERSRRDDMNRIEIDADKRHLRVRGGENQR